MFDLRFCRAGYDETARHNLVSGVFEDCVGFASNQTFVDFDGTFHDYGVRANLTSRRQNRQIVEYDVFDGNLLFLAVANHDCFGGGYERQFVNRTLCSHLLEYAYERIEMMSNIKPKLPKIETKLSPESTKRK